MISKKFYCGRNLKFLFKCRKNIILNVFFFVDLHSNHRLMIQRILQGPPFLHLYPPTLKTNHKLKYLTADHYTPSCELNRRPMNKKDLTIIGRLYTNLGETGKGPLCCVLCISIIIIFINYYFHLITGYKVYSKNKPTIERRCTVNLNCTVLAVSWLTLSAGRRSLRNQSTEYFVDQSVIRS